jgi:hypothetical protein
MFQLGGNAKDSKNDLGKVQCRIKKRFGKQPNASPGPPYVAGNVEKVGRIARQAVNSRDDNHVAIRESGHQFF